MEKAPLLKWDKFGYLSNEEDILQLLDNHWTSRYLSTTDPEGEGAQGEAANGSLSPQNLPSQQLSIWRSSD